MNTHHLFSLRTGATLLALALTVATASAEDTAYADKPVTPGQLKKYDANKDGVLDETERAALVADQKAKAEKKEAKVLEKYDADKDGKLSDAEKDAIKAEKEARKAELKEKKARELEKYDLNKDGKIDQTEAEQVKADKKVEAELKKERKQAPASDASNP